MVRVPHDAARVAAAASRLADGHGASVALDRVPADLLVKQLVVPSVAEWRNGKLVGVACVCVAEVGTATRS